MAILNINQIASVAYSAGFRGNDLVIATAVVIPESGGNTNAINANDTGGTQSFGLWQINSVHTDLLSSHDWRDPRDNARMAFVIWQRQGWRAWGAFNSNAYLLHVPQAKIAAAGVEPGNAGFGASIDVPNPLDPVQDALKQIGDLGTFVTDPHMWLRVLTVVTGFALLVILMVAALRNTDAFKVGKKVAETVITRKTPAKGGKAAPVSAPTP